MLGGAYGLAFIASTSQATWAGRQFLLFDDAMVSMRYARNLARGSGLVWNPDGARVEGFTNLLWTLWMAALHATGLSGNGVALCVQLSGLACLLAAALLLSRWKDGETGTRTGLSAGAATLACFSLVYWSCLGLEVGAVVLATVASFVCLDNENLSPWPAALLLAFAALLRQDAVVPILALWSVAVWRGKGGRRRALAWAGSLALALSLGLPTLWRHAYYGDWLPNTYYLKMQGVPLGLRLPRGAYYYLKFLLDVWPFAALAGLGFTKNRKKPWAAAALAAFAAVSAYSVWVGGDAWEVMGGPNRFLCSAMPFLFLLAASALQGRRFGVWLLAAGCLWGNAVQNPYGIRESLFLSPAMDVAADATLWNQAKILGRDLGSSPVRVGVISAGHLCYDSNLPCEDLLGKCDRTIAHGPVNPLVLASGWRGYIPGHAKWDDAHTCALPGPLLLVQTVPGMVPGLKDPFVACGFRKFEGPFGPAYSRK